MVKLLYRRYRKLSYEDRCNIVHLRYGTLTHLVKPIRTTWEISQTLAIKQKSVEYFCRKFESQGQSSLFKKQRLGVLAGTKPLTDKFENDQWLLREDTLKKWSNLTMQQRAAKIKKLFGVQRAYSLVHSWYRKRGIIYRKTHFCFRAEVTTVDLPEQRAAYA